jgi:hypothetical protein
MRAAANRQFQRTELIDGAEPDFASARILRDEPEAHRAVRIFLQDPHDTPLLRLLLASQNELLPLERLTLTQISEQVVRHLIHGRLRLAGKWDLKEWRETAPRSAPRKGGGAPMEYAPVSRAPAPREPEPAPKPDEAPPVDQDHQAAVLEQASHDGVPFCEECEKLKRQGTPAQDAQAQTLEHAAHDGVPFCAECERLKQEREQAETEQEAAV